MDTIASDPQKRDEIRKMRSLADIKNELTYKFRDTYLYRYCEGVEKRPIFYVFLTNFKDDPCLRFKKQLQQSLPAGVIDGNVWQRELLKKGHIIVLNEKMWGKDIEIQIWQL